MLKYKNIFTILFCVFNAAEFTNNVDFDLTGIFKLSFNLLGNIFCKEERLCIVYLFGFYDDTYFSTCLNCITLIYPIETGCNRFEFFQTLHVVRTRFSSCAGTSARYRVCSLD